LPTENGGASKSTNRQLSQPARATTEAFAAPSAQTLPMPRAPRVGMKLSVSIEILQATEGARVAELAEAMV
jgi:hypothetical protein